MNKLVCLVVLLVVTVAAPRALAQADADYDALHGTFVKMYNSLRAKGGVGTEDHGVIRSLRDRATEFNRQHPGHEKGLALELQLSIWLQDDQRMGELYEQLTLLTGDLRFGMAWVGHFEALDDRQSVGAIYARLLELYPDSTAIRRRWAEFVKGTNQYRRALEILDTGAIDPAESPRAVVLRSDCLFAEQRFGEAVEALESIPAETLAADPTLAADVEAKLGARRPYLELWDQEQQVRSVEAAVGDLPRVEIITVKGPIVVELFENEAPNTVANFIALAESGFYNGTTFHRVLPNFMSQGGDPNSKPGATGAKGTGNPGYHIADEHDLEGARSHFTGTLAMANNGQPNTGGCQFYITHEPTPHLNGKHTVFGRTVEGLDIARSLDPDDLIETVTVLRKRDHEYKPTKLPLGSPFTEPFATPETRGGTKPPTTRPTEDP